MEREQVVFNCRIIKPTRRCEGLRRHFNQRMYKVMMFLSTVFTVGLVASHMYMSKVNPSSILGMNCNSWSPAPEENSVSVQERLLYKISILSLYTRVLMQVNAMDGTSSDDHLASDPPCEFTHLAGTFSARRANSTDLQRVHSDSDSDSDSRTCSHMGDKGEGEGEVDAGSPSRTYQSIRSDPTTLDVFLIRYTQSDSEFSHSNCSAILASDKICNRIRGFLHAEFPFAFSLNSQGEHVAGGDGTLQATADTDLVLDQFIRCLALELQTMEQQLFRYLINNNNKLSSDTVHLGPLYVALIRNQWHGIRDALQANRNRSSDILWNMQVQKDHTSSIRTRTLLQQMWYQKTSHNEDVRFLPILLCEILKPMCVIGNSLPISTFTIYM